MMMSSWLFPALLVAGVALLAYTAIVIIEEKDTHAANLRRLSLGPFTLEVPSWWRGQALPEPNQALFLAGGDWRIFFAHGRGKGPFPPALIADEGIVFDGDVEHSDKTMGGVRLQRIRGSATRKQEQRLYLDAWLVRDTKNNTWLYGEGKSAVLEGMVEGPYFEACLDSLLVLLSGAKTAHFLDEKTGNVLI